MGFYSKGKEMMVFFCLFLFLFATLKFNKTHVEITWAMHLSIFLMDHQKSCFYLGESMKSWRPFFCSSSIEVTSESATKKSRVINHGTLIVGKHIFKYCWYIWDKWYVVKNAWINMDGKVCQWRENRNRTGIRTVISIPDKFGWIGSRTDFFFFSTRVDLGSL